MGFLGNLFGKIKVDKSNQSVWTEIENLTGLDQAISESKDRKVVIFKHSTRCFISKSVLNNFEKQIEANPKDFSYYFLDLIEYRGISNEIAKRFDVTHQSPQVIVLENGVAIYNASHDNIDLEKIN